MAEAHERTRGVLQALAAPSAGLLLCAPLAAQTQSTLPPKRPAVAPACSDRAEAKAGDNEGANARPGGAPRLRLEIERHVGCLDLGPRPELPRFEERVDVEGRTAEALLARFLEPQELLRGATPGGAPGVAEMQEYRPGATPGLNLLPVLQQLGQAVGLGKSAGSETVTGSFFLYRVRTASGDWPLVRDGRLPPGSLSAVPGVRFELLGEYPDWGAALTAYRRFDTQPHTAAARVEPPRPAPTP